MASTDSPAAHLNLIGGALCLDFCNTVGGRRDDAVPRDYLASSFDLVRWSEHAGALAPRDALAMQRALDRDPARAARVLTRARQLREALYAVFATVSRGQTISAPALAVVNEVLGEALNHLTLVPERQHLVWSWHTAANNPDHILWSIAQSAAELLTSPDLARVRECSGDDCSWLFLDASKNHSRRWCDMRDCGNRAKARRHYARQRRGHASLKKEPA